MSADRLRRISFVILSATVRADGFLTGNWFSTSGFVTLISNSAGLVGFKFHHKHKCCTLQAMLRQFTDCYSLKIFQAVLVWKNY